MTLIKKTTLKKHLIILWLLFTCLPCFAIASGKTPVSVIPAPMFSSTGEHGLVLKDGDSIAMPNDLTIQENTAWIASLIEKSTGISFVPAPDLEGPSTIRVELISEQELKLKFEKAGLKPPQQIKDAYSLGINLKGISIQAAHSGGLLYGMTTLWQLASTQDGGKLRAMNILDAPQFEWRGLMLDSARHMQSVEYIKNYIDWMSLHKMNVFHWHFTDDQAWRIEIKAYPKLVETGGYRVPAGAAPAADIDPDTGKPRLYGGYYTQEQIRDVVAHATMRNIIVIPEVDVPGHATAAIAAYPELGVAGHDVTQVPSSWGIYNNVFNLEESTFEFLETVLAEVVQLFPGPFIHLGGDEVQTTQWEASSRIKERMTELGIKNLQSLQNYYVERLQAYLDQHDRRVIGWDEILESELPGHAAVMSWRGVEGAITAAEKGHQTVLSPAPTLYLDHIQSPDADQPPGRGGVITTKDIYEFDPLPESLGENREFVLGIQGNIWTEHIRTEERVSYMTWPRATAIAELGWSTSEQRNWLAFEKRLAEHKPLLSSIGIVLGKEMPVSTTLNPSRREDRELELCSDSIVLALEDDAPIKGERESYLFDIMNPCWIWRNANLTAVESISAAVGQLPFNFEIGSEINNVVVETPRSTDGELNVRLGQCDGMIIATLPLAPAIDNQAKSELAPASLAVSDLPEKGDLCFSFTRNGIDPMWAIDWVQLNKADQ